MKPMIYIFGILSFVVLIFLIRNYFSNSLNTNISANRLPVDTSQSTTSTAIIANGCFWCVEHDLEKIDGVLEVVSGYAGGTGDSPTYENYAELGHREVVLVTYDSSRVSFANLVEHIIKHGDPTDDSGSFFDRGQQYAPAIYVADTNERTIAESVIASTTALQIFAKPLALKILPRVPFFPAEAYHQDYAQKNPIRYGYFRNGSGRDAFIRKYWGDTADQFTITATLLSHSSAVEPSKVSVEKWHSFVKPSDEDLRKMLTPEQYSVTQKEGTEPPHRNLYDKNYAIGIYVDVVSGEPLFLSRDKYDSQTGWPSFVKPISPDAIVLKEDKSLFSTRTEVRSHIADSHLGHVFDDGPSDRGGKRYCMNSAALRFVSLEDMERSGYGSYAPLLEKE